MTTQYGPLTDIPVKLEIVNSAYLVEDATYANLATVSKTTVSNTYVLQYQTGVTFDISSEFANGLYVSGTPKAFVISLSDENSNDYCYPINSSEVTNVSLRPNLTVRYGYTLPAGLADGEVISIENVGSGGYLYPHSGFIGDGTNILHSYASNLSKAYQFILEKNSETGGYSLRHNYDPSVNAKITADPSRRVVFGRTDNAQTQEWLIVPYDNDTFKIVLRSDMRLCLTAVGTPSSSNSDTSITTNGHVIVSMSMTPAQDNQLWYIVENGTYLTTGNASSVLKTGDYYFNNAYTGKFLHRSGNTTVNGQSGLLSSLGESSIKWRVTNLGDGYCTIQRADMPNAFLAADSTSSSTVKIKQNNSETISDIYKWEIRIATGGGCLIKSKYTGKYLYSAESSSSSSSVYIYGLYSSGSTSYDKQRWRVLEPGEYDELKLDVSFDDIILEVDDSTTPALKMSQTSVDWASLSDFTFSQVTDTVEPVLNINFATSYLTALSPGVVEIKAVHKVTGITRYFDVCIDRYTYELMETFGFSKNDALLIRGLYDKIDDLFPSETKIQRAWKSSRLLGGLVYNNDDWWNNFKWSNVAGKVYDSDEKGYFVDTLNYTETEYNQLKNVVKTQHNSEHPDFAHMQIYLSARLAYQLDKDGFLSNLGTFCSDEEVSYRAGWLGDAITVVDSGTTSMGNDDYCADLDAENIFRIIIQGKTTIEAIEEYYSSFSSTVNRATTFLGHISYETVRDKVFNHLYLTGYNENNLANMKEEYPDTYNFLKSLEDQLAEMGSY